MASCKPEPIKYKENKKKDERKQPEVYLRKQVTKDYIYFLWENKTPTIDPKLQAEVNGILKTQKKQHKHKHRDRQAETTMNAKYTYDLKSLELVNPD